MVGAQPVLKEAGHFGASPGVCNHPARFSLENIGLFEFARSGQWVPVVIGVVTALVVHLTKTAVRPAANVATAGVAAPVLSTIEDFTSVSLVFIAILVPALVLVVLAALAWGAIWLLRRRRRRHARCRPAW